MDDCYNNASFQAMHGNLFDDSKFRLHSRLNPMYTLPGILEFLQAEWTKMELERSEWLVERAEMQARITFLQAECKEQDRLRTDLVRRIKMLEYALVQERAKRNRAESTAVSSVERSEDTSEKGAMSFDVATDEWQRECERFKCHLAHCGLGDAMDRFREQRVRELLSFAPSCGPTMSGTAQTQPNNVTTFINGKKSVIEFESGASGDGKNESWSSVIKGNLSSNISEVMQSLTALDKSLFMLDDLTQNHDPETSEAIATFDWLVAQQGSSNGCSDFATRENSTNEQELLNRLKEQYLAERLKVSRRETILDHTPTQFFHNDTETNDADSPKSFELNDDIDVKRPPQSYFSTSSDDVVDDSAPILTAFPESNDDVVPWCKAEPSSSSVDPFVPATILESPVVSSSLGLGDLASLTVANESESCYANNSVIPGAGTRTDESAAHSITSTRLDASTPWTAKYTLRSHFDAIRALAFHPTEPIIVTASEDQTLKLWNLNKTVQAKKSTNFDVEPLCTFRGHQSPLLALAMWTSSAPDDSLSNMVVFSGDLHGRVRSWRIPHSCSDPYGTFDPAVNGPFLRGHSDAIWSLCVRPDGLVLSASADGTGCLWSLGNPWQSLRTTRSPISARATFQLTTSWMSSLLTRSVDFSTRAPVPTSTCFVHENENRFLAGFTSGHISMFDLNTSQLVTSFQSDVSNDVGGVTCLLTHPQHSLAISAHEDNQIRFYDLHSGKCVHSMVAHLDTVTSLSLSTQGDYLLSSSHDCSIRLWNVNKKTCIQEMTSHRKKFGESIHAVAFHQTKQLMASAGADAVAKIFV